MSYSRFGVIALASVVCLSLSVADASAQRRGGGGGGGRSGGGGGGGGRAVGRPGPSGGGAVVGRAVPRGGSRTVVAAPRGGYYGGRYYRPYYGYGYGRPYYYPRAYYGYGLPYYRYPAFSFGFSVGVGYPYYGYGYYGYPYYRYPYYGYPYPYSYPYYGYGYGATYPAAGYVSPGYSGYAYGSVKIQDAPHDAQVFVDGTYAGIVDDFDGAFQSLDLQAGAHQLEIRIPGRPPLQYDVNVQPGQTVSIHVR
jgi:hypothetical protein